MPHSLQRTPLVLVVDYDEGLRRMIAQALTTEYRVVTAANADDGFVQAIALHPDLVVSDIQMPGFSGTDLLRRVRKQPELTAIPFLMLTDGTGDPLRGQVKTDETTSHLTKPFSVSELRARVAIYINLQRSPRRAAA